MKQKTPKKKTNRAQWLMTLGFMSIGGVCGILMIRYLDMTANADRPLAAELLTFGLLILAMYAGILLQIILHEAGHLIGGLLSGYRFSSFRIFSLMLTEENGKLHCKRFSLAGTGGQCLMAPPTPDADGHFPFVLYNLGGSLMNLLTTIAFILCALAVWQQPLVSTLLLMLAVIGFGFALLNGLPLRLTEVDNDGRNIRSIGENPETRRAFWLQLAINEQTARGVALQDMPDAWFTLPSAEGMKNSMCATIAVFAANRLLAQNQLTEADALMARLLAMDSGMIGIHRSLLICDRLTCEALGENRAAVIDAMLTRDLQAFMKAMKTYPSILRTQYILALCHEKNEVKAKKLQQRFEKMARTYPYPADLAADRMLMDQAATMQ